MKHLNFGQSCDAQTDTTLPYGKRCERLTKASQVDEYTVRSHGKKDHERQVEMTCPLYFDVQ